MATNKEIQDLVNAIKTEIFSTNPDEERLLSFKSALSTVIGAVILGNKYTVNYLDFQINELTEATIVLGKLPAGAIPIHYKIKPSIAFAINEDVVDTNLILKDGNGTTISGPCDLTQIGNTKGLAGTILHSETLIIDEESESNLSAKLTITASGSSLDIVTTISGAPPSQNQTITTNNGATANIVSIVNEGGPETYSISLDAITGDQATWDAAATFSSGPVNGNITDVGIIVEGGNISDLTAGEVDIWIWFLVKI